MRVGIYGLGRFGFFWASCLSRYFEVVGFSRNNQRETPPGVKKASESEVLSCDAVFLCVTISAMEEVIAGIAPGLRSGTTVFDTCSVKMYPVDLMDRLLPEQVNIVGTHPMFGPDSGKNGIEGLPLAFCPVRVNQNGIEAYWRQAFAQMGLRVLDLTPEEHDREAAYTQGITHFMGRVLFDLGLKPSAIATKGYEKLLEIIEQTCNDPFQLFLDLQRFNPYTEQMREHLHSSLQKIQNQLKR